jgi:RNA polymerase sigma factor for flagellar operon FliA
VFFPVIEVLLGELAVLESKVRRRLTESESERLVTEHAPLVRAIAQSLLKKLPASVEFDDLVQDGFIGLLGAILQTTKARVGAHYLNYISQRVRGAMLDGLRDIDPATRSVRRAMRAVEHAINQLGHQLGRSPNEDEVARSLAMPLAEYQRLLQDAHGYTLFSIEDFDDRDSPDDFLDWCMNTRSDPLAALERRALQRKLLMAISDLSEREDEVMTLRYVEDLTMLRIGERLNLTEGRISQIHSQATAKLRAAVMDAQIAPSLLATRRRSPELQAS